MTHALVIAGLSVQLFDRIKQISGRLLVPNGLPIISPLSGLTYDAKYIQKLLKSTYEFAKGQNETKPFSTLLLYVDYNDQFTSELLNCFFPFSLPVPLCPPDLSTANTPQQTRSVLNEFADQVIKASTEVRKMARVVAEFTNVQNLTPLLLPLRNFQSERLTSTIVDLYRNLAGTEKPKDYINALVKSFVSAHPRVRPPDDNRHCFTDGRLFFRSPGRDRHGIFRNAIAERHDMSCLLNARSRVGGHYPANFHFDCMAARGDLAKHYPNCHGVGTPPSKNTHVNISPNDFIR